MRKPIIGLTTSHVDGPGETTLIASGQRYIQAVERAGGLPVLLPLDVSKMSQHLLVDRLDGIVFTGGGDINPRMFEGEHHPAVYNVDPEQDEVELNLFHRAIQTGLPFLGICRGLQLINVAMGGTLYTHILDQLPDGLQHSNYPDFPRDYLAHRVNIREDSLLYKIVGKDELLVNSMHHQGVKTPGKGLHPSAQAEDGLIEALEVVGSPFGLAVQWHPEALPMIAPQLQILLAFVSAAQQHHS